MSRCRGSVGVCWPQLCACMRTSLHQCGSKWEGARFSGASGTCWTLVPQQTVVAGGLDDAKTRYSEIKHVEKLLTAPMH